MSIYLDEDMVGQDNNEICYPHLVLCMGVTVQMSDGTLIGGHFTTPTTEAGVGAEMVQQIAAYNLLHGTTMRRLYCTANLPEHITKCGGLDIPGKANLLHFHGDAYSFDSSTIDPKDGTFVAVRSNGPNERCGIHYKREEKVKPLYVTGAGPNVSKFKPASYTKPAQVLNVPTEKTGLSGPIHKLHTATFLLQIKYHRIP